MARLDRTLGRGQIFAGNGEMLRRVREFDWASSSLGPIENWPESLKTTIRVMLGSHFASSKTRRL
jgi:hypothetical protein